MTGETENTVAQDWRIFANSVHVGTKESDEDTDTQRGLELAYLQKAFEDTQLEVRLVFYASLDVDYELMELYSKRKGEL